MGTPAANHLSPCEAHNRKFGNAKDDGLISESGTRPRWEAYWSTERGFNRSPSRCKLGAWTSELPGDRSLRTGVNMAPIADVHEVAGGPMHHGPGRALQVVAAAPPP